MYKVCQATYVVYGITQPFVEMILLRHFTQLIGDLVARKQWPREAEEQEEMLG